MIVYYILCAIIGYGLGSLSLAIFLSRNFYGTDIREKGSGNAGANNMARVYGWRAGLVTFFFDAAKAGVAMIIGKAIAGDWGICLAGVFAMAGHCFPVMHGFRGGKGVSVSAALALAAGVPVFAIGFSVFLLTAAIGKKVSLGSMLGALVMFIVALCLKVLLPYRVLTGIGALFVLIRHKSNIGRILKGTEPNFHLGGK